MIVHVFHLNMRSEKTICLFLQYFLYSHNRYSTSSWYIDSKQCVYRATVHCLQLLLAIKVNCLTQLTAKQLKRSIQSCHHLKLKENAKLAVAATTTGCLKTIKQRYLGSLSER